MNWPIASDYHEAVQNPRFSFEDPELKSSMIVCDRLGLPRVAAGYFASVYEARRGAQCWAVRCFLQQVSDQQQRYQLLSQYLSGLSVPALVGFQYLPRGIRIQRTLYPIVKMEWVDGEGLHTFIGKNLNNPRLLLAMASQCRHLMSSLRQHRIAHGDLQHGNILVIRTGEMRLVDYDGMFVPLLAGKQSSELGHPNFQHPKRTAADYNEALDNFAALVIYTSLRALVADPDLWRQFHTGENLVLTKDDYNAPSRSPALKRMKQSLDMGVRQLAAQLEHCIFGPMSQVPDFEAVVAALPAPPTVKVAGANLGAVVTPHQTPTSGVGASFPGGTGQWQPYPQPPIPPTVRTPRAAPPHPLPPQPAWIPAPPTVKRRSVYPAKLIFFSLCGIVALIAIVWLIMNLIPQRQDLATAKNINDRGPSNINRSTPPGAPGGLPPSNLNRNTPSGSTPRLIPNPPEVQEAILHIISNTDDTEVSIDGASQGRITTHQIREIRLSSGRHLVRATKPGHQIWEQTLNLDANISKRLVITMKPLGPTPQELAILKLKKAQQLYLNLEYDAAIAACNEGLQLDPSNPQLQSLKTKILKTVEILRRPGS